MTRKNISQYQLSWDEARENEPAIRSFLLKKANIVRYTVRHDGIGCIGLYFIPLVPTFPKNYQKHSKFREFQEKHKEDYIRKETNNYLYDDVPQFPGSRFHHYYYKLTENILSEINEITLLSSPYGFEDPTFYYNNQIVCSVISHEPIIVLFITEEERKGLNQEGVLFDSLLDETDDE